MKYLFTVFTLVDEVGNESEIENSYRTGLLLYSGGTVCDENFDDMAANAICRYMGYTSVDQWESGYYYSDIQDGLDIKLNNVDCISSDWETCSFTEEPNCNHSQDVFLACFVQEETGDATGNYKDTQKQLQLV